jgi:hypothetical protein
MNISPTLMTQMMTACLESIMNQNRITQPTNNLPSNTPNSTLLNPLNNFNNIPSLNNFSTLNPLNTLNSINTNFHHPIPTIPTNNQVSF